MGRKSREKRDRRDGCNVLAVFFGRGQLAQSAVDRALQDAAVHHCGDLLVRMTPEVIDVIAEEKGIERSYLDELVALGMVWYCARCRSFNSGWGEL